MVRPLVLVGLVSFEACLLTTSLDGYTGGTRGDAQADGRDAPLPSNDGGGSPCADENPKRLFCADFSGATPISGWEKQIPTTPLVTFDDALFVSPPRSAAFQLVPGAGNYLLLLKTLGTSKPNAVTFAAAIYLDSPSLEESGEVSILALSHLSNQNRVDLRIGPAGISVETNRGGTTSAFSAGKSPITTRAWFRYSLVVRESPPVVEVRVQDELVLSHALPTAPLVDTLELRTGILNNDRLPSTHRVLVDDAVLTAE